MSEPKGWMARADSVFNVVEGGETRVLLEVRMQAGDPTISSCATDHAPSLLLVLAIAGRE